MTILDSDLYQFQVREQQYQQRLAALEAALNEARIVIEHDQQYLGTKTKRLGEEWLAAHPAPEEEK